MVDLAARLAGRGAAAGRPRTVDLRAGISRAYYAVFHEITSTAAEMLLDGRVSTTIPPQAHDVARWMSHRDIRSLAEAVLGNKGSQAITAALAGSARELAEACESFVALQGLRHLADYDHSFEIDRYTAMTAVADAEAALDRLDELWRRDDPSYFRFLRMAGGAVKIAKSH